MKLPTLDAGTTSFLRRFFGPENLITWAKIIESPPDHELPAYLTPWLEDLAKDPRAPVVLPRRSTRDDREPTVWYALGHSVRDAETLREHLLAFIGPTHSDFEGQHAELDPADDVEAAVLAFTEGHAYRFLVPTTHREPVRKLLGEMRELWHQRPIREEARTRQTSRILRDFELALATGNTADAASRIDELRRGGRLDARNLLFLEIRRLAVAEHWNELLALPQLPDLARLRCPAPVAEAILRAVYAVEFASFEFVGDVNGALFHFRTTVVGRWSALFRVLSTMQAPSALKLFMMLAAVAIPPRSDLRDTILATASLDGADRAYCELLARHVAAPTSVPKEPFAGAVARFEVGDYDSAFPLLFAAPVSERALSLMLYCAVELQRLDATRAVQQALLAAPEAIRAAVLGSARHRLLWEHLAGASIAPAVATPLEALDEVPADWVVWLERLTRRGRWSKAIEVAEHGAREWLPAALLEDAGRVAEVQRFIAARASRDTAAQSTLRSAIPYLVAFLLREPRLLPRAKDLLLDLLLVLTDDEEAGASDLSAVRDVVSALLDLGPGPTDYREYVGFLHDMWTRFEAPRSLDWLLDVIELLTVCPCAAPEAREQFLAHALTGFTRWRGHVQPDQWRLLRVFCRDLDAETMYRAVAPPEPASTSRTKARAASLDGCTIAIYSLMERSARHARETLLDEFPGATVVLSADTVATDRLRELSQRADVFVMVTWAAKHAATGCIESARPSHLPLLRPISKSATAILREVRTYLGQD